MILFNDVENLDPIIKPDREERDFDLWILWADFKICLILMGAGNAVIISVNMRARYIPMCACVLCKLRE